MTKPCAVVLSVYIGVGGCLCPIFPRSWRSGLDYLQLVKSAPSSASDADDMNALMILEIFNTAPLLGGNAVLLDIKKFIPALIMALDL